MSKQVRRMGRNSEEVKQEILINNDNRLTFNQIINCVIDKHKIEKDKTWMADMNMTNKLQSVSTKDLLEKWPTMRR